VIEVVSGDQVQEMTGEACPVKGRLRIDPLVEQQDECCTAFVNIVIVGARPAELDRDHGNGMAVGPVKVDRWKRELLHLLFRSPVPELPGRLDQVIRDLGLFVSPRPQPGQGIVGFRAEHLAREFDAFAKKGLACFEIELIGMFSHQEGQPVLFLDREELSSSTDLAESSGRVKRPDLLGAQSKKTHGGICLSVNT